MNPPIAIPEVFTASRDFKRPLRAMLTDLQTIEQVRLIESAHSSRTVQA
jgi:hypothetical protein